MEEKNMNELTFLPKPPKEWIAARPRLHKFEIEPLDVELAQLVFEMTKRLPAEVPSEGPFEPIVEQHQPNRCWYMNFGLIEITCCCYWEGYDERVLYATFWDKDHTKSFRYMLLQGSTKEIVSYVDGRDVLFHFKTVARWTNELLKDAPKISVSNGQEAAD